MANLPDEVLNHVEMLARNYANSPATTNAGAVLRFIVRFLPIDLLAKMITEKAKTL